MRRNVAGQRWRIFAFNRITNQPVTGDALNITAKIAIDFGIPVFTNDINPTEAEDGYYYFDLLASETDGNFLDLYPESNSTDVQVIGIPASFTNIRKNVADQKLRVFAFTSVDNVPKKGDAANITCKISKDFSTTVALTNVNPTEIEDGYYVFDLSQEETDAYSLEFFPESSTSGVQVIALPANFELVDEAVVPDLLTSLTASSQGYGPKRVKTPNLEVEQFDPLTIQKALDREGSVYPTFGDFGMTIVSPNKCKYRASRCK